MRFGGEDLERTGDEHWLRFRYEEKMGKGVLGGGSHMQHQMRETFPSRVHQPV